MSEQIEMINFLRSLKPFVNKQGVVALETLENVFDLLEDPKMARLNNNIQTFSALRKEQSLQEKTKTANNTNSLKELLRSLN